MFDGSQRMQVTLDWCPSQLATVITWPPCKGRFQSLSSAYPRKGISHLTQRCSFKLLTPMEKKICFQNRSHSRSNKDQNQNWPSPSRKQSPWKQESYPRLMTLDQVGSSVIRVWARELNAPVWERGHKLWGLLITSLSSYLPLTFSSQGDLYKSPLENIY